MPEVVTFFKAGTDGGPPLPADDRIGRPGSTLKARPGGLKQGPKRQRTRVDAAYYHAVRVETQCRAGGRCEADGVHHRTCPGVGEECHHIIPKGNNYRGPDEVGNTMWVSTPCHHRIHHNGIKAAKQRGFLVLESWSHGVVLPRERGVWPWPPEETV